MFGSSPPPARVLELLASAALAWENDEGELDESGGLQFTSPTMNEYVDLDAASPPNKAGQVIHKQTILGMSGMSPAAFQSFPPSPHRAMSENVTMQSGLDSGMGDLDFTRLPKDLSSVDDLRNIIAKSRGVPNLDTDPFLDPRLSAGMQSRAFTDLPQCGASKHAESLRSILARAQLGPPGLDSVHSFGTGAPRTGRSFTDKAGSTGSIPDDYFDAEPLMPLTQSRTRTAPAPIPRAETCPVPDDFTRPCPGFFRSSTSSGQPAGSTPLLAQAFEAPRAHTSYTQPQTTSDDVQRKHRETSEKLMELSMLLQLRQSQGQMQHPIEETVLSRPSMLHKFPKLEQRPEQAPIRSAPTQVFANQSNLTNKPRPAHGPKAARSATLQSSALRPTTRAHTAGLVARSNTSCSSGGGKSQQNPPKPPSIASKSMHHIAAEVVTPPDSDAEIERVDAIAKHVSDEEVIVGPTTHAVAPKTFEELWIPGVLGNETEISSVISRPGRLSLADVLRLGNAELQVKPVEASETKEQEAAESDPQPHRSFGSLLHFCSSEAACRPCMFERIPGRCRKAVLCDFCHMHSGRKKRGAEAET